MSSVLIREGFEELNGFDITEFKEYVEKMRKMHSKIRQIYDFEMYDLDHSNNLRQSDLQDLIDSLKVQHDFIHETEQLQKLYL